MDGDDLLPRKSRLPVSYVLVAVGVLSIMAYVVSKWVHRIRHSLLGETNLPEYGSIIESPEIPNRAFIIARHARYGYLVLKSFKKRKGLHGQLPGGNIDEIDVGPDAAAARELFEETGIDIRQDLRRLTLLVFPNGTSSFKGRAYYLLDLENEDATNGPNTPESGESFNLRLSPEHVGFTFMPTIDQTAKAILLHSGGKNSTAIVNFPNLL